MFISGSSCGEIVETRVTDAVDNDIFRIDLAPVPNVPGERNLIEKRPGKICNLSALSTDEMVMPGESGLEPGETFRCFNSLDQTVVGKGGKCSINRIQRNSGRFPVQALMQHLRRGMIGRQQKFAINLQALLGYLESGPPACRIKGSDFFLQGFHSLFRIPSMTPRDHEETSES